MADANSWSPAVIVPGCTELAVLESASHHTSMATWLAPTRRTREKSALCTASGVPGRVTPNAATLPRVPSLAPETGGTPTAMAGTTTAMQSAARTAIRACRRAMNRLILPIFRGLSPPNLPRRDYSGAPQVRARRCRWIYAGAVPGG